jgi:DNA-binding FadR family transcriptional regulator
MRPEDDLSRLRSLIHASLECGERRLPPEPKLSEALGVSRGKLRTLLKRVEGEGLIWRHVGKGTFVGPRELAAERSSPLSVSVNDLMDARLVLEPQLAAQAAIHSTGADIAELENSLAEMTVAQSLAPWKQLDERLHRTIAQAAHNQLLLLLYDTLRAEVRGSLDARIEAVFGAEPAPKQETNNEHRLVVDAIKSHDPVRAEASMRDHLLAVRATLFGIR